MTRAYEKKDVLKLTVKKLPSLEPILLRTDGMGRGERIRSAGRRRRFHLVEDWVVKVSCWRGGNLAGKLVIPRKYKGHLQEFDGASVPCPWVVSALSWGIQRPLGVMLIASIIHDFAFAHGFLLFRKGGKTCAAEDRPEGCRPVVPRHHRNGQPDALGGVESDMRRSGQAGSAE